MKPVKNLHLSRYEWKNRLLLIFAPTPEHDLYKQQQHHMAGHEAGLDDRDLVLFHFFATDDSFLVQHPSDQKLPITPDVASEAREAFDVGDDAFVAILIGKDGDEKFRAQEPVTSDEIFARIDAMPMRQEEMRQE